MSIDLIGVPHALRGDTVRFDVPEGETLADMLRRVQPDQMQWHHMRVWIDGHLIEARYYQRIKPKSGRQVVIKAWVGKGVLGSLISILLTIVAPWAAGFPFPTLGAIVQNLVAAGITLLGSMALQSLVRPPTAQAAEKLQALPGLRGSRNEIRRDGAIPVILGKHLMAPFLAAEPYTETIGGDVYLRQIFVVGYGPLLIEDIKIGDTPIDRFDDVEIQVRQGLPGDLPTTLYPMVAFQDGLSVVVERDVWASRFTAADVDEILIDLEWPRGLIIYDNDGSKYSRWHRFEIEYRLDGLGVWTVAPVLDVNEKRLRTIRRTKRILVARGQYEVRLRRVTHPNNDNVDSDPVRWPPELLVEDVSWTALRGFRNENPIQFGKPLAVIALRIRATEQLNGVVDQLNCVATSIAPYWNGAAWVSGATSNRAALFRHLLQGPMAKRPVANTRLDFASLQEWSEACEANNWDLNVVITEQMTAFDLLRDVAAGGRAMLSMAYGKYGVSLDKVQTVPMQMFTPRNILSASFERVYQDMPDALRVRFPSAAAGWSEDEVTVYNDGKTIANAVTFETLRLWGVTDAAQAYLAGLYHFKAAKLRPEVAEITTDVEGMVCAPGNMVRLAHDALLVGLAQGQITGSTLAPGGNVAQIRLDAECAMLGGTDYGILIRQPDGAMEIARQVVTNAGSHQDLVLVSPIDIAAAPQIGDLVAFGELGKEASDWTVKTIQREDDLVARLTLVPHAPDVHSADTETPPYDPVITTPIEERKPAPPVIISVETGTNALERINGNIEPRVIVGVRHSNGAAQPPLARIDAQWRLDATEDWRDEGVRIEGLTRFQLRDVDERETVRIRVRAVSESGRVSDWVYQGGIIVLGITEPPADVQQFTIETVGTRSRLIWDAVPGLDISHYIVRFNRAVAGATWANSTTLVGRATGTSAIVPTRVGTYLIRAVDTGGRLSVNAAVIVTSLARVEGINLVQDVIEDLAFSGTLVQAYKDVGLGGIRLAARTGVPATSADLYLSGTYAFATTVDLAGVWTARVTADMDAATADMASLWFDRATWFEKPYWYGDITGEATDAFLQVRTSQVAPASNIWTEWQDFAVGDYTCRAFQFRARLTSTVRGLTPVVTRLRVRVDMEDRRESFNATLSAAGQTFTFARGFYARPTVVHALLNAVSGDRVAVTALTANSVFVRAFNAAGTGVARDVEIVAVGYGAKE